MRAQIAVLKESLKRWRDGKKVTAKWIEEFAKRERTATKNPDRDNSGFIPCLNYERRYGPIADFAEQSSFTLGTIYDDKSVANQYEPSWRHEDLGFEHHRIAAPQEDRLD